MHVARGEISRLYKAIFIDIYVGFVDIGAFTYINAAHGIVIKDEVQIGSHCSVYTESTIDETTGPITIGKNARIGTHSTIMPGVKIGENAIIGAHSFVKKDVPPPNFSRSFSVLSLIVSLNLPVNVGPGATQLTHMSYSLSSAATDLVK